MLHEPGPSRVGHRRYRVSFARNDEEIHAAQQLRWRVFAEELGARLPSGMHGIDQDRFDPHCEHLVARNEADGEVVGTYRVLSPESARRAGGRFSECEFDLARLQPLRERMVEVGRSCVHPEHRSGAVIGLLWMGLARYMLESGHGYLAGCASMSMAGGGHAVALMFEKLRARYLAPAEYRVFPRRRLPPGGLDTQRAPDTPPPLCGYLSAGAWICGEPAWDPDFNTGDFFLLLPLARLNPRYARHFFGDGLRTA